MSSTIIARKIWKEEKIDALREFIKTQLEQAIVSNDRTIEKIETLTSDEAMKIWMASFTHSSVTSIAGQNYEGLETLGDAYIAAFFFSYVDTQLSRETRTPSYYTELRRFWLSKPKLAYFSEKMKFTNYINFDETLMKPDDSMNEDVFEAFFGALVTVGDKFIHPGAGYVYARNYFVKILSTENILLPFLLL